MKCSILWYLCVMKTCTLFASHVILCFHVRQDGHRLAPETLPCQRNPAAISISMSRDHKLLITTKTINYAVS